MVDRRIERRDRGGHHDGDQRAAHNRQIERPDHRPGYSRMLRESGLDFSWLDPEPAYFDLIVEASKKFERAIGEKPDTVAGTIHARAALARKRIGREPRRSQFFVIEVADSDAVSPDPELAGFAGRRQPSIRPQHVDAGVGQRASDRN